MARAAAATGAGRYGSLAPPSVGPQYNVSGCRDTGEWGPNMTFSFPLLLPLLLILRGEEARGMEMVSRLPRLGTITREGSPLTLSCSSSSPWFFCLWHSPIGGKQCAIQEDQVFRLIIIHQYQTRQEWGVYKGVHQKRGVRNLSIALWIIPIDELPKYQCTAVVKLFYWIKPIIWGSWPHAKGGGDMTPSILLSHQIYQMLSVSVPVSQSGQSVESFKKIFRVSKIESLSMKVNECECVKLKVNVWKFESVRILKF